MLSTLLFLALLPALFGSALAATVSVECGSGVYPSVQDAIDYLQSLPAEHHTINVQGDCPGNTSIDGLDDVSILGAGGSFPTLGPLTIANSRNIRLESVQLSGNIWVELLSTLVIRNSRIGPKGLGANGSSQVWIFDTQIEGNGTGIGVLASGAASLILRGSGTSVRNFEYGVIAESGGILNISGPVTIEGMKGCGVYLFNGAAGNIGRGVTIQNSGGYWCGGIWVERGANASLTGVTLQDNDPWGMMVTFNASAAIRDCTIIRNNVYGVRLTNLSSVLFHLPNNLSGNGKMDLSCTPESHAGVNNPRGLPTGIQKMMCPGFAPLLHEQPGAIPPAGP